MTASLAEEVLRILLDGAGSPVSGQAVAKRAGVTRAAVWKAIETLRAQGYRIESLPARGYLLASGLGALREAEIRAKLATRVLGRNLVILETVDSTNREAAREADAGAPEGTLVVAARQSAGRGRLGRSWFGAPGETLMMSLVLRPTRPMEEAACLTHVLAAALAETLSAFLPEETLEIKWPNDVLVRGRKVAGILLEARIEGGVLDYVVAGVGVNVRGSRDRLPEELRESAAVLEEEAAGREAPDAVTLLAAFLARIEEVYLEFAQGGFASILPRYLRWFRMTGREVRVRRGDELREGRVLGIDSTGALLLQTGEGEVAVNVGDVEWTTKA